MCYPPTGSPPADPPGVRRRRPFPKRQVKILAAELCDTTSAAQVYAWVERREGMLGEGEGSARVSQGDYRGEEGWEIEVCNWLPGED